MPGWLSWLERTAHRVLSKCSDLFLGYREAAGSNPAPGTLIFRYHLEDEFILINHYLVSSTNCE